MAIIRNAANTLKKGRVGETTYYISKGQQIARQSRNDSNYGETARRTESQQSRRVLWANLVNFYKISSRWMPKAFESLRSGQTDYNKFMAVNVPSARIAFTKSEAEAAACVVDNFLVSQGSLPSIEISQSVSGYTTNISVGSLTIGSSTTVADFSTAVINANANIREGMQLSFVQYAQVVDPLGVPRCVCRCYEVTIDTHNTAVLVDNLPAICTNVINGYLGTSDSLATGAFAYILSELQGGSLKVSTQLLITINSTLVQQYSSDAQLERAIQSYGLDREVILNPGGTVSQSQEGIPNFIQSVSWTTGDIGHERTVTRYPGQIFGEFSDISGTEISINCSGLDNPTFQFAKLYASDGTTIAEGTGTIDGQTVKTTFSGITASDHRKVVKIQLTFTNGIVLDADFVADTSGE